LLEQLQAAGHQSLRCDDSKALKRLVSEVEIGIVVLELRLSDGPSMKLLKWLRDRSQKTQVVILTSHSSIATAVQCAKLGASGYLAKPARLDQILRVARGEDVTSSPVREFPMRLDRMLWEYLSRSVERAGSITGGAQLLGLDRRSLRRMLSRYAPPQ
jgi:two-component system response regulator RegA